MLAGGEGDVRDGRPQSQGEKVRDCFIEGRSMRSKWEYDVAVWCGVVWSARLRTALRRGGGLPVRDSAIGPGDVTAQLARVVAGCAGRLIGGSLDRNGARETARLTWPRAGCKLLQCRP